MLIFGINILSEKCISCFVLLFLQSPRFNVVLFYQTNRPKPRVRQCSDIYGKEKQTPHIGEALSRECSAFFLDTV